MPRRLPPLNSLRSFEAAGRHLSFTKAAAELAVTQAAVSHQVKALEEYLGVSLFIRLPRKLALTRAGETLLPVISGSLDEISHTVGAIKKEPGAAILSVRLAPSFAAKWLSPRLVAFRRGHPEIDLRLYHSNQPVDFRRSAIDLAVTYGKGDWHDVVVDPVLSINFFPVCAPAYIKNDKPLTDPHNLRYYTLLHDGTYENWTDWLRLAGLGDINARRGPIMDDTNVLIQAAIDGQGVALGSTVFVAGHLRSKQLISPFDLVLESEFSYYIVCPETHLERPAVLAFRDWILEQADEH